MIEKTLKTIHCIRTTVTKGDHRNRKDLNHYEKLNNIYKLQYVYITYVV
jgi:hypothetical protein